MRTLIFACILAVLLPDTTALAQQEWRFEGRNGGGERRGDRDRDEGRRDRDGDRDHRGGRSYGFYYGQGAYPPVYRYPYYAPAPAYPAPLYYDAYGRPIYPAAPAPYYRGDNWGFYFKYRK